MRTEVTPEQAAEAIEAVIAMLDEGEVDPAAAAFSHVSLWPAGPVGPDPVPYDSGGVLATAVAEIQSLRDRVAVLEAGGGGGGGGGGDGPTVDDLTPGTAVCGSADFDLTVTGSGYDASSVIVWNGAEVPTTYVGGTTLTMRVSPAGWLYPVAVPVTVRTGGVDSADTLQFLFTAAAAV